MDLIDIPFSQMGENETAGPWLPVTIANPRTRKQIKIYALIDTGADECALPTHYAPALGCDLQRGIPKSVDTGNGITFAYSHKVRIKVKGLKPRNTLIDFYAKPTNPIT